VNDPALRSSELLHTYILEAPRLSPPITPFLRVSDIFPSISDWRYAQAIKKGDTLLLDIATASRDLSRFPDPEQIKLDRPRDSYLPFYDGSHSSLVMEIVMMGLGAQLRVLGKLHNVTIAPEMQGTTKLGTARNVDNFLSGAHGERNLLSPSKFTDTCFIITIDTFRRHETAFHLSPLTLLPTCISQLTPAHPKTELFPPFARTSHHGLIITTPKH
jgi:hypothetical protein